MKIVLSGVETNNKGAELMLYAILQEIERKYPDANVYIPYASACQGLGIVTTSLNLKYTPFSRLIYKIHLTAAFRRLHLPLGLLYRAIVVKHADFFIDASGFHFSDQKKNFTPAKVERWNVILKKYKEQGTRIVFLPQAFGPASKKNTLDGLACISKYSDVIMPREEISFNYLKSSGVVNMEKVHLFTDFTSLVSGVFPVSYEHLKNGICIIPNMRMVDTEVCSMDSYVSLMTHIIGIGLDSGHPVYLLNHEGKDDEQLAYLCSQKSRQPVEVVSGLNALEVKGLISSAYLVISSRFHGVASSLNSGVPCLATSWSHKYHELFNDYGMSDCVLPLDNSPKIEEMVNVFLVDDNNKNIRKLLRQRVTEIKSDTKDMWDFVWNGK